MRIRSQMKHGNERFAVDYKDANGKRHQRFFKSYEKAVREANKLTDGLADNSICALFELFLTETRARRNKVSQKSIRYKLRQLRHALREINVTEIDQINPATFSKVVATLQDKDLSEHSVVSYVTRLKAVFNWAVKRGLLEPTDVPEMSIRQPNKGRQRWLSKDEIKRLMNRVSETWLELPTALGLYGGLRRRETCELQAEDIDLDRNELTVRQSKTGESRTIKLHPELRKRLEKADLEQGKPVCSNQSGDELKKQWLSHAFKNLAVELGWHDVTYQTLRATMCSQMAQTGKYTLYQIAKVAGHKCISTTEKHYAHLMPNQVVPAW